MSDQLQLRGGTAAQCNANVPAAKELWVDTTLNSIRVGDGALAGGHLLQPAVITYPGNPNGNVAGSIGVAGATPPSLVWDIVEGILWVCTTTGTATTAVWGPGISPFTGDSGAGGLKGIVPAPAAGDAALYKVLGAGGGWIAQR